MSVVSELKRRNVFRVALFYIVSAWLLVQVAETVLPVFGVPDVFTRGVIVVLVLGFVPALVFAWIFELTPEGLKREAPEAQAPASARPISQKLNVATLVVAVLAIGLLAFDRFSGPPQENARSAETTAAAPAARSIAVLAFDDLELRNRIAKTHLMTESLGGFIELLAARTATLLPILHTRFQPSIAGTGFDRTVYDFEQLATDVEFVNVYANALNLLSTNGWWLREAADAFVELRDDVGAAIGRAPRSAPGDRAGAPGPSDE